MMWSIKLALFNLFYTTLILWSTLETPTILTTILMIKILSVLLNFKELIPWSILKIMQLKQMKVCYHWVKLTQIRGSTYPKCQDWIQWKFIMAYMWDITFKRITLRPPINDLSIKSMSYSHMSGVWLELYLVSCSSWTTLLWCHLS